MEENKGQILLYQTPDGESRIEVTLQGETVWLSLDQMGQRSPDTSRMCLKRGN